MSALPLLIGSLFRRDDEELRESFTRAVGECGYAVENAESGEELLVGGPYDLVVVDAQLPGQLSGIGLLESLAANGEAPAAILFGEESSFNGLRDALRLGVRDFVPRPLDAQALIESLQQTVRGVQQQRKTFLRSLAAVQGGTDRGARALGAFLLEQGVRPSHRIRVCSAVAEILHVVCREAGEPDVKKRIGLRASVEDGRAHVEVTSQGEDLALLAAVPPALPGFPALENELSRAEKLSETLKLHPTPGGSRVVMTFELNSVRFEEDRDELVELDYLHPNLSRRWVPRFFRSKGSSSIPSVLTTTFGRLITPRQPSAETLDSSRS